MMTGGIYQFRNVLDNAVYVGSAKDFEWRRGSHLYELRRGTHINPHFQRAFIKHGEKSFVFEVLEELGTYDKDFYFQRENIRIDEAKLKGKCYNIAKAEGGWTHHTLDRKKEISQKISLALKTRYAQMSIEEIREVCGRGRKGKALTPEQKQAVSKALMGRRKTVEMRNKLSAARMGSEAAILAGKRVGASNKGKPAHNRRQVIVDDKVFPSLKEAAMFLGTSSSALCHAMKTGVFKSHDIRYHTIATTNKEKN